MSEESKWDIAQKELKNLREESESLATEVPKLKEAKKGLIDDVEELKKQKIQAEVELESVQTEANTLKSDTAKWATSKLKELTTRENRLELDYETKNKTIIDKSTKLDKKEKEQKKTAETQEALRKSQSELYSDQIQVSEDIKIEEAALETKKKDLKDRENEIDQEVETLDKREQEMVDLEAAAEKKMADSTKYSSNLNKLAEVANNKARSLLEQVQDREIRVASKESEIDFKEKDLVLKKEQLNKREKHLNSLNSSRRLG